MMLTLLKYNGIQTFKLFINMNFQPQFKTQKLLIKKTLYNKNKYKKTKSINL